MGLLAKMRLRELKAQAKHHLAKTTGNRELAAKARTEQAEAKLLRTQTKILETTNEIRREHGLNP